MPISVVCPGCSAKLNAPDAAAGKKVKCPKCQGPIVVPAPNAEPDFEVVEDEAPPPAKKPAASAPSKPAVKVKAVAEDDEDEDEDEQPRAKKAKAKAVEDDEDEEDAKPKKKAKAARDEEDEDEDEDEEKPKKKKGDAKSKKKKKNKDDEGGVSMTRYIISAVLLVVLVIVAGAIFYDRWQTNKEIEAENEKIRTKNAETDPTKPAVKDPGPNTNPNPKQPNPKQPNPKQTNSGPPKPTLEVTPKTEEAVKALTKSGAEVLRNDAGTVTSVILKNKKVDDQVVLPHLLEFPGLLAADLSWNPITDAVLEQTQGKWPKLTMLVLNFTKVTDKGVALLAKSTPRLEILSLAGNKNITNAAVASVVGLPLQTLMVGDTGVTDEGLASVGKLGRLDQFTCSGPAITDAGVAHLKNLVAMQGLGLSESSVTDEGLIHLKKMKDLEFLGLDRTKVTDAGLEHLKGLKKLKRLRLSRTAVTPEAEAALKSAIPGLMIERDGRP